MKSETSELDLLFDAARAGDEPSAADRQRVTARVAERLALGAGAGAVALAVSRFGWAAPLKTWAVMVVVVAGAGAGGYSLSSASLGEHPALTRPSVAHPTAAVSQPAPSALSLASPPPSPPVTRAEPEPALPRASLHRERAGSALTVPSAPATSTSVEPSNLARETAALRAANEALRAGTPARALELLDELAKQFPHGMLAEEALATRISALCALGRLSDARALGSRFVQRYPRSPVAARVRGSCAVGKED